MKIQCNVCEVAEATVLCCADEAALCRACDEEVHAANKLASKHQRVPLSSSSSQVPKCDICQEAAGYFFCLEDRALLCRKCDVAIHSTNTFVSAHQRFLLTGVKVGLEPNDPTAASSSGKSHSTDCISEAKSPPVLRNSGPMSSTGQYNRFLPTQVSSSVGNFASSRSAFAGGSSSGGIQQWHLDDIIGLPELNQNYRYMDNSSSKADNGKLGDSDCSPIVRAGELELESEECLGLVPDASWAVPQMPSPPTASGLISWPKSGHHEIEAAAAFVPDVCYSSIPSLHYYSQPGNGFKRRRQF